MREEKIQSLGCTLTDPKLKEVLFSIASLPHITRPVVCLPDIHLKETNEAPCSFVAAVDGVLIPELTAPSVGCGMGIIRTSLTKNDLTPEKLETFYAHMQEHRSVRFGTVKNILLWLGIIDRPRAKYDFSKPDLADAIRNGARFAVEKYNLPSETLDHVEYQGDVMDEKTERAFSPLRILPRAAWASGRHDIGYGFKGNHFLEIQYIENLPDEATARAWGLHKDQVVIMYHGGGGAVSYYMGRYFANRKKDRNKLRSRLFQNFGKLIAGLLGTLHANFRKTTGTKTTRHLPSNQEAAVRFVLDHAGLKPGVAQSRDELAGEIYQPLATFEQHRSVTTDPSVNPHRSAASPV